MKKLLLLLVALFMAMSAYAECTFFVDPTEFEITEADIENGNETCIPIHAFFSARVSAWQVSITYPEGMTATWMERGPDFEFDYINARGRTAHLTPSIQNDGSYTLIISTINAEGYYQENGNWVSYGVVKWEAGEYEDFLDLYVVCDENYHGGDLVMTLTVSSGSDPRGGTVVENGDKGQFFTTTSTLPDPYAAATPIAHDVNGDGEVNIADLNAIINAILTGDNINSNMDVNGDGEINIADCNAMIYIILDSSDDSPHAVGQSTEDHLFVRNTYNSQTVDNVVNFKNGNTQLVWVWLDDDMMYLNEAVQNLEPMAYNSSGSLYNEITYNSLQCDIYLPQGFAIVEGENEDGDYVQFSYGDRMPTSSNLTWAKKPDTKIIDGVVYDVYTLFIYSYSSYGSHFSGKNASMYRNNGALKKDAAPLFGIYLTYDGQQESDGELGEMLIGKQEFFVSEAYSAGWTPNEYRFFYGTGGNNVSQRNQFYNRVRLVDGDVPAEDTNYYIVGAAPFGDWHTNAGAQMTRNINGTYSYTTTINGTVWFVLADALTEVDGDWDTFNTQYRYGPISGHDETVEVGTWYTTRKQGNGSGAYKFTGDGSEYVFTFNPATLEFKIEGNVTPTTPDTYTVVGTPASIFGTEWDTSNTDNDMTLQDNGTYMLLKQNCEVSANEDIRFRVLGNHSWEFAWPEFVDYNVSVPTDGIYDFTFTFNPENEEVSCYYQLISENIDFRGDVNDDGEVNTADLDAIINAILTGDNINSNMDVNGDGEINIADCNAMIDIILNWSDDSPHAVGQPTEDHLFVRNTYNSQTVDNVVNFKNGNTQLVWVWLDDDMMYLNEAVQYLEPMAYNSSGSLYNEITYNSLQCDIYLPQGFAIVEGENEDGDYVQFSYGDRMPTTSNLIWSKKPNTKIIDGVEYDAYTLIIYNTSSYGNHFSGKNASMYRNNGALKKDAAPLFGIYLTYDGQQESDELGEMLICNQEFYIGEAYTAGWTPNEYRFFYGTGGNNVSQRNQLYNRVRLVDGDLGPVSEQTPAPEITTSVTDNSVIVTAMGEGDVKLYIDGVAVSNPYTINRGAEDMTYTATATAQGDGMLISETVTQTVNVPAMQADGSYLYISDFQIPVSKLGNEIMVPVKAHFDGRLNGWLLELSCPEGLTPVGYDYGGGMTISYLDSRGNQKTLTASMSVGESMMNALSFIGTEGYWLPEGSTRYETYGAVKWEAGDYGEMILIYFDVDPDFAGGQLVVNSSPSAGKDTRGGTTAPGQYHSFTTNITVGGRELQGEIVIGDCDANGKVPVAYTGDEDVTLDVMVDGKSVPVIDGMVQLTHYGTTLVSVDVSAIGYVPLHDLAEVSWIAISNADWEILKAFYAQYQNEYLVWDLSDRNKPGSCPGVASEDGRVTAIELPNHALEGTFPCMLLSLSQLRTLDLSYNNLSGDAAADMSQYAASHGITSPALQTLLINNNQFTGNVGALAALFPNLETLNAAANRFGLVYPMINPAVTLYLSNQLLEMDGDITNGIEALATSLPTICLYDHVGQTFSTDLEADLADATQTPDWTMYLSLWDGDLDMSVSGPYRGANGQTLDGHTYLYCDNWSNEQILQMLLSFAMGDANFNGPVDITDLQAMVKYIFGEYNNRPFNYTAANLNNDNTVNVQDVVGEANLLLSMELTMPTPGGHRAPSMEDAPTEAFLYWDNGVLYLNTTVPVSALDIVNEVDGDISWNLSSQGFAVRTANSEQGNHTVIYSLDDAVIQPGVTAIATTTGRIATVVAAKLSDAEADLVTVRLNDSLTGLTDLSEDGKIQCHIEGRDLIITCGTKLNDVDIAIYTVDGRMVSNQHLARLDSGRTAISLNGLTDSYGYYIIVVRSGKQIIATRKLTQNR